MTFECHKLILEMHIMVPKFMNITLFFKKNFTVMIKYNKGIFIKIIQQIYCIFLIQLNLTEISYVLNRQV